MPRWVALLRAVNLGPVNKVAMPALRRDLEDAGFAEVSTYLNSGNVVLTAPGGEAAVRKRVEAVLAGHLGKPGVALVRSGRDLAALTGRDPFAGVAAPPGRHAVTFLPRKPPALPLGRTGDLHVLAVGPREVFTVGYGPPGRGGSPVDLLPPALAAQATTRTWGVVRALAERAG